MRTAVPSAVDGRTATLSLGANAEVVRLVQSLYRGQPGHRAALDRDNDGVACE
ncbi:excalibur calcium-binding domain-containing protein [Lentzea sp. DG1S-22]|uniref:excalibur calcium-binding domain-containing protein n=1 Tax=Lentzea sp. DG1S-22 TaxID=3108822 RepID=UPI002E76CD47|nr:excalibur calcium-binding domain-containing protein [Lentzea sp. DG1S-22]WVH77905.1 excalibur calcium-binding domain-containing protein [Lentzea sp. DG1S-22]